ncbi:MAG: hypothetical protein RL095_1153 [Verrucomicrobiota bacterium]|jgi:hypothetical protein
METCLRWNNQSANDRRQVFAVLAVCVALVLAIAVWGDFMLAIFLGLGVFVLSRNGWRRTRPWQLSRQETRLEVRQGGSCWSFELQPGSILVAVKASGGTEHVFVRSPQGQQSYLGERSPEGRAELLKFLDLPPDTVLEKTEAEAWLEAGSREAPPYFHEDGDSLLWRQMNRRQSLGFTGAVLVVCLLLDGALLAMTWIEAWMPLVLAALFLGSSVLMLIPAWTERRLLLSASELISETRLFGCRVSRKCVPLASGALHLSWMKSGKGNRTLELSQVESSGEKRVLMRSSDFQEFFAISWLKDRLEGRLKLHQGNTQS